MYTYINGQKHKIRVNYKRNEEEKPDQEITTKIAMPIDNQHHQQLQTSDLGALQYGTEFEYNAIHQHQAPILGGNINNYEFVVPDTANRLSTLDEAIAVQGNSSLMNDIFFFVKYHE